MKYIYVLLFVLVGLHCSNTFAADPASGESLSQQEKEYSNNCNLEARNALVHGDMALVEKVCTQAINELEKSHAGKEVLVNPIMNLAFSYTLTGRFEKASPLYNRARDIREKLYGADSRQLKEIDDMIKKQEEMKRQHKQ
ncbi:MAG: tetratricopeptide repeat protein [Nitrospirae bacterium]|nr:tetratricopeptide repeat protein [Nitrospirota bacterium]